MKASELIAEIEKYAEAEVLMGSKLLRIKDVIYIKPSSNKEKGGTAAVGPLLILNPDKDS
jgi:hypothetical protein